MPVLRARMTTMSRRRVRENEMDLPDAVVDDHPRARKGAGIYLLR